jgi:DNA segregation ATPase FtsK/SpoIIIE, S-DNA-T family
MPRPKESRSSASKSERSKAAQLDLEPQPVASRPLWPGLSLSLIGLLLSAALWFPGSLGLVGKTIRSVSTDLAGFAGYLIALSLTVCGGIRLFSSKLIPIKNIAWAALMVIALASLSELLSPEAGGSLGKIVGRSAVAVLFGRIGGILLCTILYLIGTLGAINVDLASAATRVIDALKSAASRIHDWVQRYLQARREAAAQRRAEAVSLAAKEEAVFESLPELPPEKPAKIRAIKSATDAPRPTANEPVIEAPTEPEFITEPITPAPAELAANVPARAEPPRPAPKIIDSTALPLPKPTAPPAKPEPAGPLASIHCENYELPSLDLLDPPDLENREAADPEELLSIQNTIIDTLQQFGIDVSPGDITRGPTITRYEVYPAKGIRVDRIVALEKDIARSTRAERINILAPIPGKDTVGIEIANSKKQKVTLRELFESEDFAGTKCKIPIALGKDVYGKTIIGDLAAMPHGLVAGTTGSGKSVCINAIIASVLYRFSPEDLRFIMIDPKVVEMQMYNALPHLVVPVVTDPKRVLLALRWAIDEMEKRYAIFAKVGVRNIGAFNTRPKPKTQKELDAERAAQGDLFEDAARRAREAAEKATIAPTDADASQPASHETETEDVPEEDVNSTSEFVEPNNDEANSTLQHETDSASPNSILDALEDEDEDAPPISVPRDKDTLKIPERMPYIVIIVDELADLMQTAPADVESAIARITQKARAAGIHMIIATQTPRADVITGVIKANVPCRIAFQVASALDSRVILDENGAERLLGQGDMLYRPPGTSRLIRSQGVLVTDEEVRRLVEHAAAQSAPVYEKAIQSRLERSDSDEEEELSDEDEELLEKCIEIMRQERKASTSLFQRRLRLGYTRAARVLDILESRGYVGLGEGAKPRDILVDLDAI